MPGRVLGEKTASSCSRSTSHLETDTETENDKVVRFPNVLLGVHRMDGSGAGGHGAVVLMEVSQGGDVRAEPILKNAGGLIRWSSRLGDSC